MRVSLRVNGESIAADVEPRTSLADFLRGTCGFTGTHLGCEHGVCGACTIVLDGKPARSCIVYAVQCDGCEVRTIEGFDDDPLMELLRTEFSREHALQCGFCTPGMLITAQDIVRRLGDPGEARVREELAGNLCRCTGYAGIVAAVRTVGKAQRIVASPPPPRRYSPGAPVRMLPSAPAAIPELSSHTSEGPLLNAPGGGAPSNGTEVSHSFTVQASCERVWELFHDLPAVMACIPGAELLSHDQRTFSGRIVLKIGPVRAQLQGAGRYSFDEDRRSGSLDGSGQDRFSRSHVRGHLGFVVTPSSPGSTRVDVRLQFSVQGMLAQFSRSSIAQEISVRVLDAFAERASLALSGKPVQKPSRRLGLFVLLRDWFATMFRR